MKKYVSAIFILSLLLVFAVTVSANEPTEAEEIPLTIKGASGLSVLTDGDEESYKKLDKNTTLTLSSEVGIDSLYLIFDKIPGKWTLSDGETEVFCGENSFLHEFVDVGSLFGYSPTSLSMIFTSSVSVSEFHAFRDGELPSWVQVWEPPCEVADLMLCSTHIDDEQLFFAGILPYFAGELRLNVQVVYFTYPFTYHDRPHEQLNGLWTVGVKNYPVWGEYYDKYSETLKDAYAHQEKYGFDREHMVDFQVEMLRRFRPLVVVGHDFKGEYSHGQHMINTDTLVEALPLAADPSYHKKSADEYGVWDTPKTYIHLYGENEIVMNWDEPLDAFGGKTAFEVTRDGFLCHKSQHWTWFYGWIFGKNGNVITKASEIKKHSPCKYGLYRTTVGYDSGIGDMFENLMTYGEMEAERLRLEEESRAAESESIRLMEESIAAAESESLRIEEESRAAESESIRLMEESIAAAESESRRLEQEAKELEEKEAETDKKQLTTVIVIAVGAVFAFLLIIPQLKPKKKTKLKKRK